MRYVFLILLTLSVLSCNRNPQEKISEAIMLPPPVAKPDAEAIVEKSVGADKELILVTPSEESTRPVAKKIIKEGEISFKTDNIQQTRKKLLQELNQLGGYTDEENENNDSGLNRREYVLKVRIPAQNFDRFLDNIGTTARQIDAKSIRVQDVTTRYIDINTRLSNKQLLESRYKQLLQQSTRMADILQVENKLNEIRTDIETTQGELNYLNKQIAYSSLEITFYTQTISGQDEGTGFGYEIKHSLADGWQKLQDFFFGLLGLWPFVLLISLAVYLFKRWRKRKRQTA